ncbi:Nuclease-related domain-containing protein [Fibrobacter sp. UWT3]|uniref:nuclease-related domain-containing protein n=1 Tax=Fibrobacter sp. UWT3 TaxID=1896225 RepID=UPI000BC93BC2|nr:nuclease-related domain-containing protein [Fibrobacter sp. UWT3]SOE52944.1 Nuclease-related domain-containing protein [Fibrobacter sp. UWT3]
MGLLDSFLNKRIGPVFLKESSDSENFIVKMNSLLTNATGSIKEKIEEQIKYAEAGLLGEKQIVFELKNSGIDMYVLHDIYLEKGDLSAQIDFLLITRRHLYVIECKNLFGNIEIDAKGNFIRHMNFGKAYKKEGLYSPITQNQRHLNVLKEVRREVKTGSFLGLSEKIFDNTFAENYQSIVVLANPKTVLNNKNAPKEIKSRVIRADQLVAFIKAKDDTSKDVCWTDADMRETIQYFLDKSLPNKSDYSKKYEEMLAECKTQEVDHAGV